MVTNEGIIITTSGVIVSAIIGQIPAIIREWRSVDKADEDKRLALETLATKNTELELANGLIEKLERKVDDMETQLLARDRRIAILEEEVRWYRDRYPDARA